MQNMKSVEVPIYDFATHQRSPEVRHVEPADVVIIEGILVLHIESIRELLNMKIFVDTDDDLRLARRYLCVASMSHPDTCSRSCVTFLSLPISHRGAQLHECMGDHHESEQLSEANTLSYALEIFWQVLQARQVIAAHSAWVQKALSEEDVACRIQRDVAMRGRDIAGVIEQYTKFVKPAFDTFVAPSRKHADVIIPWGRSASVPPTSLQTIAHSTLHHSHDIGQRECSAKYGAINRALGLEQPSTCRKGHGLVP